MFIEQDILKYFYLPISFEEKTQIITNELKQDLELDSSNNPYKILLSSKEYLTDVSYDNYINVNEITSNLWREKYSYDVSFITQMQDYIKKYKYDNTIYNRKFINDWLNFKNENNFLKKYEFFDWKHLDFLNKNETVLQITNYLNITSPLISFLLPFILFLIPLIIIIVNKQHFSLDHYLFLLKNQLKNHAFGKIFSIFDNSISMTNKLTASLGLAFYFFTTYQNILLCLKVYNNIQFIQEFLYKLKIHIAHTMDIIRHNLLLTEQLLLNKYNKYLNDKYNKLEELYIRIPEINNANISYKSFLKIGHFMKLFYDLYHNNEYYELIMFSFGINGFSENIESIQNQIKREKVNKCIFSDIKKPIIKQNNYVYLLDDNKAKYNDINLSKNMIIHGPNASGKTTILKSTLLNIIFSQQFGYGCYKKCIIPCYRKLYSYINIPDTSDRDSLFQAEARRCLDIINDIKNENSKNNDNNNYNNKYLSIYDELYSGTNPKEAILSAKGYLKYLENNNIQFMLTTHFDELKKIDYLNNSKSYFMDCEINKETYEIKYKYKIKAGISTIIGGCQVLEQLNYPKEIIDFVKTFV